MTTLLPPDPWGDFRRKDESLRRMFDALITGLQPDILCDIGCFNGDETARFLRLIEGGRVVAFEADANNYRNLIMPRPDVAGAVIENVAVADSDGTATFHPLANETDPVNWKRAAGSLRKRTDGIDSGSVTIPACRLDSYFNNDLDKTFMLWIDVEGALDRVLAGGKKVLRRTYALRCEVERDRFWEGQKLAEDFVAHFEEHGFILLGDTYSPDAHPQSDVLFLHRDWLAMKNQRERARLNRQSAG
jgi:FkbM family methyltransferase